MDTHKNARLTWKGREEMVRAVVDRGMSKSSARPCTHKQSPKCLLSGVERTCASDPPTSAYDPSETLAVSCRNRFRPLSKYLYPGTNVVV